MKAVRLGILDCVLLKKREEGIRFAGIPQGSTHVGPVGRRRSGIYVATGGWGGMGGWVGGVAERGGWGMGGMGCGPGF